jgi:hypothetical protein
MKYAVVLLACVGIGNWAIGGQDGGTGTGDCPSNLPKCEFTTGDGSTIFKSDCSGNAKIVTGSGGTYMTGEGKCGTCNKPNGEEVQCGPKVFDRSIPE